MTNEALAEELLRWADSRDACNRKIHRKGKPLDSSLLREAAKRLQACQCILLSEKDQRLFLRALDCNRFDGCSHSEEPCVKCGKGDCEHGDFGFRDHEYVIPGRAEDPAPDAPGRKLSSGDTTSRD